MAIYMMRDDGGYTPGSNTIAYYPLESNGNDYSGNGHNLTWNGTPTYTTSGGTKNVVSLNGSTIGRIATLSGTHTNYTINVWCKPTSTTTWQELFNNNAWSSIATHQVFFNFNGTSNEKGGYRNFAYQYKPNGSGDVYQHIYGTSNLSTNTWYNVVVTSNSSGIKLYLNGTQIGSNSATGTIILDSGGNCVGGRYDQNPNSLSYKNGFNGYMSEFIFDGTTWTAQEVLDYYNDTKSNYGIGVLPSAYQEVEYIESNGTQHIDTGLTVSGNVKADYEYMPKENVSSQASGGLLFSMDTDWKNNGFGSGNVYLYFGNQTSSGAGVSITTLAINTKFHDIVSKDGCSRNGGTVWTPSSTSTSPTGTLKLFCSQRNGSIINHWWTRMFTFKRYDNDVLTQDLVPCYRKSDSVAGLYDLVNDQFFTNAGTGTFTVGPDV